MNPATSHLDWQMDLAQRQIDELEQAKDCCARLRVQNGEYVDSLWHLASDANDAIGFEHVESLQQALRNLNRPNDSLIDRIEQECNKRIDECRDRYSECQQQKKALEAQWQSEGTAWW